MKSTKTTEPAPALAEVFCQTSSVEITLEEFRQTRKELSKKAEAWANSDKGRKRGNTRIAK